MKKIQSVEHPGKVLLVHIAVSRSTIKEMAGKLDIDRVNLSRIINGRAGITAKMALKLAKLFHTTPEVWMDLQRDYDLWKAKSTK